jgi:putative restriction endonuclease
LANGRYAEAALRNIPRQQVGVYLRGRSVRALDQDDFADLVVRGFPETLDSRNAERFGVPRAEIESAAETVEKWQPPGERSRRVETLLTNKVVREASFRNAVYKAYANRCAVTGLELSDAKGNCEAQAAHIWSVADGGPDVVQNGVALTATVHWLFDRYLISLTDDHRLLIATNRVPRRLLSLFDLFDGRIRLPLRHIEWPHPVYLKRHRDKYFALNAVERTPAP